MALINLLRFKTLARLLWYTAATHLFVGGDRPVFVACLASGVTASLVQAVLTRRNSVHIDPRSDHIPIYAPIRWATAFAATYWLYTRW